MNRELIRLIIGQFFVHTCMTGTRLAAPLLALREQRIWGVRERLFERVLPRLTEGQLANLLYAAHQVDGIVKGLKSPGWPADAWQALHRLAQSLCGACGGAVPAAHA